MEFWREVIDAVGGTDRLLSVARAMFIFAVGLIIARVLSRVVSGVTGRHFTPHHAMIARRTVLYLVTVLFLISALRELGFSLTVVLGAAGVFSVAVGFASQTSASNLISGLFLLAEKPFSVGDIIRVAGTTGEVLTIDLLSVKLRTFDNLYVRIPNETLIKSEVTNLTRFPIRRIDIQLGVAYKEEIERTRETLFAVADANPLCLDEPEPLFIFQGFGDSALNIQFSVWAKRENFLDLKNSIHEEIKQAFDLAGIEIPFPHRTIYAGSASDPIRVSLEPVAKPSAGD